MCPRIRLVKLFGDQPAAAQTYDLDMFLNRQRLNLRNVHKNNKTYIQDICPRIRLAKLFGDQPAAAQTYDLDMSLNRQCLNLRNVHNN